jgi:hypothetical protein
LPPSNEDLRDLRLVAAPPSLWKSIEADLDGGRMSVTHKPLLRRWQFAVAALVLAVAALYWGVALRPRPQWDVERSAGSPVIYSRWTPSRSIRNNDRIAEGQWLQTDPSSRAVIHVGDIGTVVIDPNTRVRLSAARPGEHRITLAQGRISASVTAPPRIFFVDTPASTAVDLGCAYIMDVDADGTGSLQVTLGWVALEWGGREALVPAGASCRTRPKTGPGTPAFDDAPQFLKQALNKFDFGDGGDRALQTVLDTARARDTLTLWHLLSRVDSSDRIRVFNRMVELAPLPNGISSGKVLDLDADTLRRLREELAWKW